MAVVLQTRELENMKLGDEWNLWSYCGLDTELTAEIKEVLAPQLHPDNTAITYDFSRAMMGPAYTMMRRGLRVDFEARDKALWGDPDAQPIFKEDETKKASSLDCAKRRKGLVARSFELGGMAREGPGKKWKIVNEDAVLQRVVREMWGQPLNFHSAKEMQAFFYEHLKVPPEYKWVKGKRRPTLGHDALENIAGKYLRAEFPAKVIMAISELTAMVEVLEKGVDEDGRMRCAYNVVGTETGRWNSKKSHFDTGTNLQNITKELRSIFIPDDGYVMFNADLEQAESRLVAYLSGDEAYIKACESENDLHTAVCKMLWSDLNWPSNEREQKEFAEKTLFDHIHSYRHTSKRCGHGTNYLLSPNSLARQFKMKVKDAMRFNLLYLGGELTLKDAERYGVMDLDFDRERDLIKFPGAFSGIRRWHQEVREQIQTEGYLITPFQRKRVFWGRRTADATVREAVAFGPQSSIVDLLNWGLWSIWDSMEPAVQVLGQGHDAVLGQVKEKDMDRLLPSVLECMLKDVPVNGRTLQVPVEMQVGANWRDMCEYT